MAIPPELAARTNRAIEEARELQIAAEELRRWAQEIIHANELIRDWLAQRRQTSRPAGTALHQKIDSQAGRRARGRDNDRLLAASPITSS